MVVIQERQGLMIRSGDGDSDDDGDFDGDGAKNNVDAMNEQAEAAAANFNEDLDRLGNRVIAAIQSRQRW
jgi:hypothetical protein